MGKLDASTTKEITKYVDDFMKKNKDKIADWKEMDAIRQSVRKLEQRVDAVEKMSDLMDRTIELKVKQLRTDIEPILHERSVKEIQRLMGQKK